MGSQQIENYRENAEIYHGDTLCKKKALELFQELNLPKGLLPLDDLVEVGHNRSAGFVWLRRKKKREHFFPTTGKLCSYTPVVTAFVENRRMKKVTGVKSKELFIWVTISDIYIDGQDYGKITFKTPSGLGRSFPVSAFELVET
ncbi:uncharacterized protein LOC143860363 [Tasmannia lanceolata]|uniref:uncharacterized protein LOC143860363 n=1 Tax=Tasmannia lanceolata TaxID=3420 RepID=UPI004062BF33